MKTRNRIIALLILDTAALVLATVVTSTAMAAPDEDASNNGITAAPKDIKSLKITVVDVNHKPIEGAKIRQNQVHKPPVPPSPSKRTAIKNHVYASDKTGSTTITWPGESVDLRIWASKPGYVPLQAFWIKKFQSDGGQIPSEFKFVMKAGTKIGGVVKDEDGKPVEGAKVEIYNQAGSIYSRVTDEWLGKPGRRPIPVLWLAEDDSAITTDSDGRWIATNIPEDEEFRAADKEVNPRLRHKKDNFSEFPLRLRVKHSGYVPFDDFEPIDEAQPPTLRELRSQTAVVVLRKRHVSEEPVKIQPK